MNIAILKDGICIDVALCDNLEAAQELFDSGAWPDADDVQILPEGYGVGDSYIGGIWTKAASSSDTDISEEDSGSAETQNAHGTILVENRIIKNYNRDIGVQGEYGVEVKTFSVARYWEDVDLSGGKAYVYYKNVSGAFGIAQPEMEVTDNNLTIQWAIGQKETAEKGVLQVQLVIVPNDEAWMWKTQVANFNIARRLSGEGGNSIEPGSDGWERLVLLADNIGSLIVSVESDTDAGMLTYEQFDGTVHQIALPEGPEGPQGLQGLQGLQGIQGEQGAQGIKGDKGDKGDTGPQGPQGEKGDKGDTGATGATGPQGEQGPKGDTGATGPQGAKGDTGATGSQGPQGELGKDGTGVTILGSYGSYSELATAKPTGNAGDSYLVNGDLYVWSATESKWVNVGNIQGPQGEKGDKGDTGAVGPQGLKGDAGATGPQGTQGIQGEQGPQGVQGLTGATGETGLQGEKGDKGDTGPTGPQGEQGLKGDTGAAGAQGAAGAVGPTGATGATGSQGAKGDTGPGVASGGTEGQVLFKASNDDFETSWNTVTKSQIGLGNVDNTSDTAKPVSTAQQAALDAKAPESHASTDTIYGVGTITEYGHLKVTASNGLTISSGVLGLTLATTALSGTINSTNYNYLYRTYNAGSAASSAVGNAALAANTGTNNTAMGGSALTANTTGTYNTGMGYAALRYNTDGTYNTGVGYNAGPSSSYTSLSNTTCLGNGATATASNQITLGNSSITSLRCQVTSITSLSDRRIKEDIEEANTQICLDTVLSLPVSRYKYKDFTGTHLDNHVTGWLADDVENVFPKAVQYADEYFPELDENGDPVMETITERIPDGFDEDGNEIFKEETRETPKMFLMEKVKNITMSEATPTLWGALQRLYEITQEQEAEIKLLTEKVS